MAEDFTDEGAGSKYHRYFVVRSTPEFVSKSPPLWTVTAGFEPDGVPALAALIVGPAWNGTKLRKHANPTWEDQALILILAYVYAFFVSLSPLMSCPCS